MLNSQTTLAATRKLPLGRRGPKSLEIYIDAIKDDALLTADDEARLARAIAKGDDDARSRMIRANLRLVVRIARDYLGRGLTIEDLIGEGNLGLIRAAEGFDPKFGARFSTYAGYWIKQTIRHALTNTTAAIRVPSHMVGLLTKWRRAERALHRELGQAPTDEQVAVQLGLTDAQLDMVRHAQRAGRLQFENAITRERDGVPWSPDEAADDREPPVSATETDEVRLELLRHLEGLDDRERMVLTLRYGLEGHTPQTLKEIGRRLGVTREWARRVELCALSRIKLISIRAPRVGCTRPI